MKYFRIAAVLLAVSMVGVLAGSAPTFAAARGHVATASAARQAKSISFAGSYSGTASLLFSGSKIKIVSVSGKGTSSVIGASTVSATGSGTEGSSECVPFKGTGSIKGKKGTLALSTSLSMSKGCANAESGPVTVTITGKATVTKGTGGLKGAKGTLKISGKLKLKNTTGSQSGSFTGAVTGKLTT
jgi:hypothetical protein